MIATQSSEHRKGIPRMGNAAAAEAMPTGATGERERHVRPKAGSHLGILVFLVVSLGVTMSVSQDYTFAPGSLQYYLTILPAAVLPLFDLTAVVQALVGRARMLLAFLVIAGTWHVLRGDLQVVLQLGLLVWVLTWISTKGAKVSVRYLVVLYVIFVVIGSVVFLRTDLNGWGVLPGTTTNLEGAWRVSFFPNIANTGILSLAMFFVLTKDVRTARSHPIALCMVLYFLVFSFVRTSLIGAALYVALRVWFARRGGWTEKRLFWTAIIVGVGVNLMIAGSAASLIADLQEYPLVSRLLLQSAKTELTPEAIFRQMYRPWLWKEHLALFASSPWLMGWGDFDFYKLRPTDLFPDQISLGSESLPTRLLATYGLPAFFFIGYLISNLRERARQSDVWAVACFPAIVLLLMNWGGAFHPGNYAFVIVLMIVTRCAPAFARGGVKRPRTRPRQLPPDPDGPHGDVAAHPHTESS